MKTEEKVKIVTHEIFYSPIRHLLFRLLVSQKESVTISQLHKGLFENFPEEMKKLKGRDYKNTYKHLKHLEKKGAITLKANKKEQGKPVYVSVSDNDFKWIYNRYLELSLENISKELKEKKKKE